MAPYLPLVVFRLNYLAALKAATHALRDAREAEDAGIRLKLP